jgi:hypothetical protein
MGDSIPHERCGGCFDMGRDIGAGNEPPAPKLDRLPLLRCQAIMKYVDLNIRLTVMVHNRNLTEPDGYLYYGLGVAEDCELVIMSDRRDPTQCV